MAFQFVEVLLTLWNQTIAYAPNMLSAAVILLLGLIIGKLVGKAIKHLLERARLDYYVSESKKPVFSLAELFSLIGKWFIYLMFIQAATDALGIVALSGWVARIVGYIPGVIGATLIVVVGYVLAEWIKEQIKRRGTLYAGVVGKMLAFFIVYVAIAMALPVLGVSSSLISSILLIIIGAIGLGIAVAIGLGLKDAIKDVSTRYVRKYRV